MIKNILFFLRGVAMGAADVIPGVSGGTIAFITGIYEKLLNSIKSIDDKAIKMLFRGQLGSFWRHINGAFLSLVFGGILVSVFSLARVVQYLLIHQPIPLWSFFFGLIIASAIYVLREIKKWRIAQIFAIICGVIFGAYICIVSPSETTNEYWFIFISGAIAICAMILPGISGSFILLLLGKYHFIMNALTEFNLPVILVFAVGAIVGIVSFSHLLTWLLKRHYNTTICILAGIMIGSLIKVWPWQLEIASGVDAESFMRPVSPFEFSEVNNLAHNMPYALLFMAIGFLIVFIIEYFAKYMRKRSS